jgi:hypothetical protein
MMRLTPGRVPRGFGYDQIIECFFLSPPALRLSRLATGWLPLSRVIPGRIERGGFARFIPGYGLYPLD